RLFIGIPETGKLSIRTVDLIYSDPEGAYARSGIEPGEYAITSPIQAAFDGMNITVMERMPDGTIKTYEPASETDEGKTEETVMAVSGREGAEE
ncbi:MAG: hypothetical protein R3D03_24575, partial [Geminicoccaceae bacterium]